MSTSLPPSVLNTESILDSAAGVPPLLPRKALSPPPPPPPLGLSLPVVVVGVPFSALFPGAVLLEAWRAKWSPRLLLLDALRFCSAVFGGLVEFVVSREFIFVSSALSEKWVVR